MGAELYWYYVKYQPDLNAALQELRKREFESGRYNPVIPFPEFPPGPDSPAPGAQHASIAEAMEDAAEDGTRSILDLHCISESIEDFCVMPLDDDTLRMLYGTARPTHEMVEEDEEVLWGFLEDEVDRAQGIALTVYKDGQPDEIFFAGFSVD